MSIGICVLLNKAEDFFFLNLSTEQKWIKYIVGCQCRLQIIKITKKNCEPKLLQNYKLLGKLQTETIVCAAYINEQTTSHQ